MALTSDRPRLMCVTGQFSPACASRVDPAVLSLLGGYAMGALCFTRISGTMPRPSKFPRLKGKPTPTDHWAPGHGEVSMEPEHVHFR